MANKDFVKSPLNYTGGKFKLLSQILPLFPSDIDVFYDIFCGGANVSINVKSSQTYAIDINSKVIELYNYFLVSERNTLINEIKLVIEKYGLSNSQRHTYDFYGCTSSDGLASYNKEKFVKLKADYNDKNFKEFSKDLLFYVLIVYGFNNQIRFNKKGEFNISIGKRDFNQVIEGNLKKFLDKVHKTQICFQTEDYASIENKLDYTKNNFVYADPPYLITTASYNESDGWNIKKEIDLLNFLKKLDDKGVKFALSNVIESKGLKNETLESWIEDNGFHMHALNFSYQNSSYQKKDKKSLTREILVTNYK